MSPRPYDDIDVINERFTIESFAKFVEDIFKSDNKVRIRKTINTDMGSITYELSPYDNLTPRTKPLSLKDRIMNLDDDGVYIVTINGRSFSGPGNILKQLLPQLEKAYEDN